MKCEEKVQFRTEEMAYKAMYRLWTRGLIHIRRIYLCPQCGYYHLTKAKKKHGTRQGVLFDIGVADGERHRQ